jgi:Calx-beta domain-containing protein
LGTPSLLTVTVQDHSTTPMLSITGGSVIEGNAGTTTEIQFTVKLSAATSRSISVHYATNDFSAFGGVACGKAGVDYEIASGTASFTPGTSSFTVPVKICGDNSAEANELFAVVLSNPVNATIQFIQTTGTITNDDVLLMLLEDSGPVPDQAAAVDTLLGLRDPFRIVGIPDRFATGPDRNTRVFFFAQNLELNPGEAPSAVVVRFVGSNSQIFDVPADDVRQVFELPDAVTANPSQFAQVKVRLPDNLPTGTATVTIRAHGRVSNAGTIRIVP